MSFTDFLNELLKSRKKKASALKAGKNKAKINDFDISDDESKHGRMKRVSFLKTQRVSFPSEDTTASDSRENQPPNHCGGQNNENDNSLGSQHSVNVSEGSTIFTNSDGEFSDAQIARKSQRKSLSVQSSEEALPDGSIALTSENSIMEPPDPEEKVSSVVEESHQTPHLSATDLNHLSSAGLFTLFNVQVTKDLPCYLPTVIIQIVLLARNHQNPNRGKGL